MLTNMFYEEDVSYLNILPKSFIPYSDLNELENDIDKFLKNI